MPNPEVFRDLAKREGYSDQEIDDYLKGLDPDRIYPGEGANVNYLTRDPNIARDVGAPALGRLYASFKSTPEGRLDFWKQHLGPERVRVSPAGEILWRQSTEAAEPWRAIEESGLSVGDLADIAGDVPELAGIIGGPLVGGATRLGRIAAAGFGAAGGNVVKQGVGAAIPGQEPFDPGDVIKAGAGGAAAQGLGEAMTVSVSPRAAMEGYIKRKLQDFEKDPFTAENIAMQARHEYPLSIAQESRSPAALMLEGFMRRSAFGRVAAAELPATQDTAAIRRMETLLGQLGTRIRSDEQYGKALAEAGGRAVEDILTAKQAASRKYFQYRTMIDSQRQEIPVPKYLAAIRAKAEDYERMAHGPGGDEYARVAMGLRKMMRDPVFGEAGGAMSAERIQHELANLGKASYARESQQIFKDMPKWDVTHFTRELHRSLLDDLAAADANLGGGGPAARLLREGRQTIKAEMDVLDALKEVKLLKFLDSKKMLDQVMTGGEIDASKLVGAEHIANVLVKGINTGRIVPSEIRNLVQMMEPTTPGFAEDLATQVLLNAMKTGARRGASSPQRFDKEAFAKALPPASSLEAIFEGLTVKGRKMRGLEVSQAVKELQMLIQRSTREGVGIPETPLTQVRSITSKLLHPTEWLDAASEFVHKVALPYELAKIMTNPEVRQRLLKETTEALATGGKPRGVPRVRRHVVPASTYEAFSE